MGPGGSARVDPRSKSGRRGPPPAPPPPPAGLGASARSEVRGSPPRRVLPPSRGTDGRIGLASTPTLPRRVGTSFPEGGRGVVYGGVTPPPPRGVGVWAGTPSGDFLEISSRQEAVSRRVAVAVGATGPPEVGGAARGRRGHQRSEGPPEVGGATRGLRGHQRPEGRSGVRPSEAAIRRLILVFLSARRCAALCVSSVFRAC